MFIGNTDDPEIYRYGIHGKEFWINATVASATYDVRMHFADTPLHFFLEWDPEGGLVRHIMSVNINGVRMVEDMNVAKEAGGIFVAIQKTFPSMEAKHGILEIRCTGVGEREAILQAVEILPTEKK